MIVVSSHVAQLLVLDSCVLPADAGHLWEWRFARDGGAVSYGRSGREGDDATAIRRNAGIIWPSQGVFSKVHHSVLDLSRMCPGQPAILDEPVGRGLFLGP